MIAVCLALGSSTSSTFTDGDSSDMSLSSTQRNKTNTLSANRTIARALLEEMGFDKGVKYDWVPVFYLTINEAKKPYIV